MQHAAWGVFLVDLGVHFFGVCAVQEGEGGGGVAEVEEFGSEGSN